MSYPSRRRFAAAAAILAAATLAFAGDIKVLVKDIYPIPSVTGNEAALAAKIASMLPKSLTVERDGLGSLYARLGSGGPIIAAALDEFGYVVSGITPEGYLTLDRAVAPPVPIYDSFLFGHPVVIGTKAGPLSGVVSQPAMHVLTRERREQLSLGPWLDWVFVDVAARNEDEVRGRGIEILDPISFKPNLAELANNRLAGPGLGVKTLAAVLAAQAVLTAQPAEPNKKPAAAQFVWMAQSRFPARGSRASLGAFRARAQLTGKTAIILDIIPADRGEKSPVFGKGIVLLQAKEGPSKLRDAVEAAAVDCKIPLQLRTGSDSPLLAPFLAEGGDAVILALAVRYAGTPAETIDMAEANQLVTLLGALLETGRIR
jgi:putative aminopeptidase FrvX